MTKRRKGGSPSKLSAEITERRYDEAPTWWTLRWGNAEMADAEMVQPPSYLNTRDCEESRDDEAP